MKRLAKAMKKLAKSMAKTAFFLLNYIQTLIVLAGIVLLSVGLFQVNLIVGFCGTGIALISLAVYDDLASRKGGEN